jgi:hypothetical protein
LWWESSAKSNNAANAAADGRYNKKNPEAFVASGFLFLCAPAT